MDWIKDITVEEVESLFSIFSYEMDPTYYLTAFDKLTHPQYGTYFTYVAKTNDLSGNNVLSQRWFLGNFGGIFSDVEWRRGGVFDRDAVVSDFNFNREGVSGEQPFIASMWVKFVAQKNKGVIDENGNDYHMAFVKTYQESRERWYNKEISVLQNAINSFDKAFNDRFNGLVRLTGYSINNGEEQKS